MKKLILFLGIVCTVLAGTTVAFAQSDGTPGPEADNWYVCKYVGPPGTNESLQTGQNPIFVDENSILAETGGSSVSLGDTFPDAQGHSLVVAGPFAPPGTDPEPVCPVSPPPPTSPPPAAPNASLSTPTCENQNIVATGTADPSATFDVFVNGVLVDSFLVQGTGTSASIPVKDGDVVTVKVHGAGEALDTETVSLKCETPTTPPPKTPPPTACKPSVSFGPWYGDPRVNITLTGAGTFEVRGGIQRFTGLRVVRKTLACGETFVVSRYKVKRGNSVRVYLNGTLIESRTAPRVR